MCLDTTKAGMMEVAVALAKKLVAEPQHKQ